MACWAAACPRACLSMARIAVSELAIEAGGAALGDPCTDPIGVPATSHKPTADPKTERNPVRMHFLAGTTALTQGASGPAKWNTQEYFPGGQLSTFGPKSAQLSAGPARTE